MNEVLGIDRSKGKGHADGRPGARAPVLRLLVVCLALFAGAMLGTACDVTTAPDDKAGNGFGPYGIAYLVAEEEGNGFGPYGIAHLVAEEEGNGFGPYGIANMVPKAKKLTCKQMHDDPVFSASSPAEAEQFEYECLGTVDALVTGSGGTHRH